MKISINKIDAGEFSAKLIDRQISTIDVQSIYDWLPSATNGVLLNQFYDFRTIKLTFLINERDEDIAYKQISGLSEELEKCDIRFSDIHLDFHCFLAGKALPERLKNGKFRITYILKNDWGVGDTVIQSFQLEMADCKKIKVEYLIDWQDTMREYMVCFDEPEYRYKVGEQEIWIDTLKLDEICKISTDWSDLFLNLGIDLQKYRPVNAKVGIPMVSLPYSQQEAKNLINTGTVKVVYMRFHEDGYFDLPEAKYPSLVWTTDDKNKWYIDLGVGQGWNVQDISIYVTGRYFDTVTNGNGCICGAGEGEPFDIALNNPNASFETDEAGRSRTYKVFESTTSSSGDLVIETVQELFNLPLRRYGFKSSQDSSSPIVGYVDLLFNGTTVDKVPLKQHILNKNLTIMYGNQGIGNYCDISRVQVYHHGELVVDAIPVNDHVKNGFINNQGPGFYDMVEMKYLPPMNYVTGETPDPVEYLITFNPNGGTLTGAATLTTVEHKLPALSSVPTHSNPNYNFQGWSMSPTDYQLVTTDTVFKSDTTVYAYWRVKADHPPTVPTVSITFDPNKGTMVGESVIEVEQGGKLEALPVAVRQDFELEGWFDAINGGNKLTTDTVLSNDATYYAHWIYVSTPTPTGPTLSAQLSTGEAITSNNQTVTVPPNVSVTLVSTSTGTIKYTTDGTSPTGTTAETYYAPIPVAQSVTIRAVGIGNGKYGAEFVLGLVVDPDLDIIPPTPSNAEILLYDIVEGTTGELKPGIDGDLNGSNATDWDVNPPTVLLPYAAVFSVPNISGKWNYFCSDWISPIETGYLGDGRAFFRFKISTSTSKKGAYIKFTANDGTVIQQDFNIASLL